MSGRLIVVGGGTAGLAVAATCARAGVEVLLLERGALATAGAGHVNGVPRSAYAAAGLEPPSGAELRHGGGAFHVVAGWGPGRVTARPQGLLDVDMRLHRARLASLARAAGAELRQGAAVRGVAVGSAGVEVRTDGGVELADALVDASGGDGLGVVAVPTVPREDLCAAAQQVREVTDVQAAARFFVDRGAVPGEVLCFTGVAGGYSIVNVRLETHAPEGPGLAILTGSLPGRGHPSGIALLQDFVAQHPWVGGRRFGGAGAVPLAPPGPRLVHPSGRVALAGDVARMVFAVHGSGIGAQLVAAGELAEHVREGTLAAWGPRWMRSWGGTFLAAWLFARFSATLTSEELARVQEAGLITGGLVASGLEQDPGLPPLRDALGVALGAAREPRLAARLARLLGRVAVATAASVAYPRSPDGVDAWWGRVRRALGA